MTTGADVITVGLHSNAQLLQPLAVLISISAILANLFHKFLTSEVKQFLFSLC